MYSVLMPILQTKLYIPDASRYGGRNHVVRTRLLERLQAGFTKKFTLICAPAGFGKSTLLSEWIQYGTHAVAWLSLDDGDNDPTRFWSYVVAALQTVVPDIGLSALELLQSPQPLSPELLLISLLNDVAIRPQELVLVLDDYHVIDAPAIHKALLFLLDHLPPHFHIILSSRSDPPWPLARWRGQGELTEVRADDLRFTPDETTVFLQQVMGLELSPAAITALEKRTEGWIAGLQLAALSLQGLTDHETFVALFSGSNRYIMDYLVEEVLSRQPEEVQLFLLQTSILVQLCGSLCDAVIGRTNTNGGHANAHSSSSQTQLEELERANLFVIALDSERNWYRYHHLFAEMLTNRLRQKSSATVALLHRRASQWYEQQKLWPEAIQHALVARDFASAADMIERVGIEIFAQFEIQRSLQHWLLAMPPEIFRDRPRLCLMYAWVLFAHLKVDPAMEWVEEAQAVVERTIPHIVDIRLAGEIAAIHALVIAYHPGRSADEAIGWGRQALDTLDADQETFRCIAAQALGMAFLTQGKIRESEHILTEAEQWALTTGSIYLYGVAASHKIAVQRAQGRLRLALAGCQETMSWLSQHIPFIYQTYSEYDTLYLNLADILREQNELDTALRYAEETVAYSDRGVNPSMFIISRLALMRIKQAQGAWSDVWTVLREVSALAERHTGVVQTALMPAITAQYQLMEAIASNSTDIPPAGVVAWARDTDWQEGELVSAYRFFDFIYLYEHIRTARAQIFIAVARATGDHPLLQETLAYLERQLSVAEAGNLRWYQVKIYLLQALAYHALGDAEQSQTALLEALRLAEPEGYMRIFLDEGEPLRALMLENRLLILDAQLRNYAEQVLQTFDVPFLIVSPAPAQPAATETLPAKSAAVATVSQTKADIPEATQTGSAGQDLVEPLTERELEILRLVRDGLSNREIAGELIVTVGTVKKHLNNIFGKLGICSRTQAIVRGRELNLL